ncbi:hypothetical protein VitviT2T_014336 [Vitis vinifera]|uniref:LRR receptor-like serine/threonine-protein kinase n=1 Tax=Vitis vinifera TaxID=29760 RepID=A0ABY9CM17_VITVI|nr:probable LRR receptor-like serine/threonine-protein kinase At1g07650 [Vitis vinifera]WJZ95574.1 hypothetical protein VitviT2T_014336 [Vitis vinifera]
MASSSKLQAVKPVENPEHSLKGKGDLMDLVYPKLGLDFNKEEIMAMMINIALLCTNVSPTSTLAMSSVVNMLDGRTAIQDIVSECSL